MEDPVDEVVLVDDHHRDVSISGIRERDRRALRDVDDRRAVERVAVHPDHRLMIDRSRSPVALETIHAPGLGLQGSEQPIALGTDEVLDRHRQRHGCNLHRVGSVSKPVIRVRKHHPKRQRPAASTTRTESGLVPGNERLPLRLRSTRDTEARSATPTATRRVSGEAPMPALRPVVSSPLPSEPDLRISPHPALHEQLERSSARAAAVVSEVPAPLIRQQRAGVHRRPPSIQPCCWLTGPLRPAGGFPALPGGA